MIITVVIRHVSALRSMTLYVSYRQMVTLSSLIIPAMPSVMDIPTTSRAAVSVHAHLIVQTPMTRYVSSLKTVISTLFKTGAMRSVLDSASISHVTLHASVHCFMIPCVS